ncbi:hypothetical protein SAMN05880566_1167 [Janthinobacterium sp. TND4EL3]|nr:hypothetical protein SAMN05880566_1167 [Janthinobacterium sp. TND4EL3]
MRNFVVYITLCLTTGCGSGPNRPFNHNQVLGMNSFALAARYGTPTTYQHQGEYLQLNYGSAAAGCQVIVLVDQEQRVAGWASSGNHCMKGGIGLKDVLK